MKKSLILFAMMLALVGCGEPAQTAQETQAEPPQANLTSANQNPEQPTKLTKEQAKDFAVGVLEKIKNEEQNALKSFANQDINALKQQDQDLINYVLGSYWLDDDALAPYTKCDIALRDLQLYVGSLKMQLENNTPQMQKIAEQEKQDYLKSKNTCEKLVQMPYNEALEASQ